MDEKQKRTQWQRLESVIRWANMTPNAFALHIGLSRGENLYQIKRGKNGISLKLAERIVRVYPEIDQLWLLTGEGEMLRSTEAATTAVPFYRVDLEQSLSRIETLTPESSLIVPPVGPCDCAMLYQGHAMEPLVPNGAILLLKKIEMQALIPGQLYAIVTKNFVTLRIVRLAEQEDAVRLVAADAKHYDEMTLSVQEIEAVYAVPGKLICNN